MFVLNNLLSWIIFGSVIGSIGYMFEPHAFKTGKPILLGICGAIITGMVANFILNIPLYQFSLVTFIIALCGASFFVVTTRMLRNSS